MLIDNYMRDMAKMKEVTKTIVETGDKYDKKLPHNVVSLSNEGTDYFSSYSHFGIHHDMLNVSFKTIFSHPQIIIMFICLSMIHYLFIGFSENRKLSKCHFKKYTFIQRENCFRCWLWHRNSIYVLSKSWCS